MGALPRLRDFSDRLNRHLDAGPSLDAEADSLVRSLRDAVRRGEPEDAARAVIALAQAVGPAESALVPLPPPRGRRTR